MSKKLPLVEDSNLVMKVMRKLVGETSEIVADYAEMFAEAKIIIGILPEKYFAAMLDLNLPDAPKGDVVDLTLSLKIPTLVLTATYNDDRRDLLFKKGIVGYMIKENPYSYEYAMKLIIRPGFFVYTPLCLNIVMKTQYIARTMLNQ